MACNYRKQHILDAFFRGALLEDLSLNLFPPADYICTEGAQNAFSHDPLGCMIVQSSLSSRQLCK